MSGCSGEDEDQTIDTGEINHASRDETYSDTIDSVTCPGEGTTFSDRYAIALHISAEDDLNEDPDEIANEKRWYPKSHFTDVPTDLTDYENCDTLVDHARQWTVEYLAEHPSGSNNTTADYYFKDPDPDGDPGNGVGSDILKYLLELGALASGNPYATAGAGFISSFIPDSLTDPVDFNGKSYTDTTRQSWHWDIDSVPSFSDAPCDSTGIGFTIVDNSAAGTFHEVDVNVRYTFRYQEYLGCIDCAYSHTESIYKTTPYTYSLNSYTSIA